MRTSDLSVKQLRKEISRITARVNLSIREYRETGQDVPDVYERMIKRLQQNAGTTSRVGEVGVGVTYKHKAQLINQLEDLQRFEKFDVYSPQAVQTATEKQQKAYSVFVDNHGDISESDYQSLIDLYGALTNDVVSAYGSDEVKDLLQDAQENDKSVKDVEQALLDAYNQSDGKGYTSEDLLNIAYGNLYGTV